jgi:hypothetical protein
VLKAETTEIMRSESCIRRFLASTQRDIERSKSPCKIWKLSIMRSHVSFLCFRLPFVQKGDSVVHIESPALSTQGFLNFHLIDWNFRPKIFAASLKL